MGTVIRFDREPEGGIRGCIQCAPTFFTNQECRPCGLNILRSHHPWLVRTWATRMTRLRYPLTKIAFAGSPGFGAAQQLSSCWDPLKSMALTQTETTRRFGSLLHFRVSKLCAQRYSLDCCSRCHSRRSNRKLPRSLGQPCQRSWDIHLRLGCLLFMPMTLEWRTR